MASLPDHIRPIISRHFRQSVPIDHKADNSPVTIADREVEQALRAAISTAYPEDAIFGEEFGRDEDIDSRPVWVLDPIDGTRAFISGKPTFGGLIGYCQDGQPVAGLIEMPALKESYIGVNHAGASWAKLNGVPISVSNIDQLAHAQIATTSPYAFDAEGWAKFEAVGAVCRNVIFGGDCHNYALLAAGHLDIVIENSLQPYDILALVPVLEGAGAVVTDFTGAPIGLHNRGEIVAAATPALHQAALDRLQQAAG